MEWTRSGLKTNAKQFLKTRYWYAFLVLFIMLAIVSAGSSVISTFVSFGSFLSPAFMDLQSGDTNSFMTPGFAIFTGILTLLSMALTYTFLILVGGPVEIGTRRWFNRTREGAVASRVGILFSVFRKGSYRGAVGGYAWMTLWSVVWSLPYILFVVPATMIGYVVTWDSWMSFVAAMASRMGTPPGDLEGMDFASILGIQLPDTSVLLGVFAVLSVLSLLAAIPMIARTLAYSMAPWILADNPTIGARRALRLSIAMTRGQKLDIFVLYLSFAGWCVLAFLPLLCCIPLGPMFLSPYLYATQSELYAFLKHGSVVRGDCTMEELGYLKTALADETPPTA